MKKLGSDLCGGGRIQYTQGLPLTSGMLKDSEGLSLVSTPLHCKILKH